MMLYLLWLLLTLNIVDGCSSGRFTFGTSSMCSNTNCPGTCTDEYTCCTDECFSINNLEPVRSCNLGTIVNASSEDVCRNTLQEIDCVANVSQSTFEICLFQVADLLNRGTASFGNVDPVNCPCDAGYTKLRGSCIVDCDGDTGRCYNTTDVWTNEKACCVNNNIIPTDADCQAEEASVSSVISLSFVACTLYCVHTCRESETGHLPACCRNVQSAIETETESRVLNGGIIALIVISAIIVLAVILFVTIWYLRKRKSKREEYAG